MNDVLDTKLAEIKKKWLNLKQISDPEVSKRLDIIDGFLLKDFSRANHEWNSLINDFPAFISTDRQALFRDYSELVSLSTSMPKQETEKDKDKNTRENKDKKLNKPSKTTVGTLTKDELFNRSLEKLEKELLYNIKLKKVPPPDLLTKVVKRTVIEHSVGPGDKDYVISEKDVFNAWCIGKTNEQIKKQADEYKKSNEYQFAVDEDFLKKKPKLAKLAEEVEAKKYEISKSPGKDVATLSLLRITDEIDKNIQQKDKPKTIRRRFIKSTMQEEKGLNKNEALSAKNKVFGFYKTNFSKRMKIDEKTLLFESFLKYLEEEKKRETKKEVVYVPIRTTHVFYPSETSEYVPPPTRGGNYIDSINRVASKWSSFKNLGLKARGLFPGGFGGLGATTAGAQATTGATTAGTAATGGVATAGTAATGTATVASTWWIWLIIAIVILIIVLVIIFGNGGEITDTEQTPSVVIEKTTTVTSIANPPYAENAGNIAYSIKVDYVNVTQPITITDTIPANAQFVSCDNNCSEEKDSNGKIISVSWIINPKGAQNETSQDAIDKGLRSFNYGAYGFYKPEEPNPFLQESYYSNWLEQWNKYMAPQAVKAASLIKEITLGYGVPEQMDPEMAGGWVLLEQIPNTFYDNCNDGKGDTGDYNSDTPCYPQDKYHKNWQVGYGIRPLEQYNRLKKAIEKMYPPGKSIKEIGDAVIEASKARGGKYTINTASPFTGDITLDNLEDKIIKPARKEDKAFSAQRQMLGILMKDDAIGAYIITEIIRDYMQGGVVGLNSTSMATTFAGWCSNNITDPENNSACYYNNQKVSNAFAAAYQAGIGGVEGGAYGSVNLGLVLRATESNSYIINQASTTQSSFSNYNAKSNCNVVTVGNPQEEVILPTSCKDGGLDQSNIISGAVSKCSGKIVSFGVEKKLLPFADQCPGSRGCGRKISCFTPTKIVLHTTWGGGDVGNLYEYFASGSGGKGVGTQFGIGKDGRVIQMAETLSDKVEITAGIANYNSQAISIELCHSSNYSSKNEVPPAQYNAAVSLVKALMSQYNIPVGSLEYTWISPSNARNPNAGPGIYGHYQLNPITKTDPGSGFMRDFRESLRQMN